MNNDRPNACQSYIATSHECRDGFPATAACWGMGFIDSWGISHYAVPICCQEELCGRIYGDAGGKPPDSALKPRGSKWKTSLRSSSD